MNIVARRLTQEEDGIPGYMAHPDGPGRRPGVLMVHHAHGVTADYKVDAYRLAQLGFLVVAGFLLINKVYSPQYVLWLLPLAALARPRWRDQLIWQGTEVVYFASVWWYLNGDLQPSGGQDVAAYWAAIVIRMLGELYLVAIVARDVLRPEHDPARQPDDLPPPPQVTSTRSNAVAV